MRHRETEQCNGLPGSALGNKLSPIVQRLIYHANTKTCDYSTVSAQI